LLPSASAAALGAGGLTLNSHHRHDPSVLRGMLPEVAVNSLESEAVAAAAAAAAELPECGDDALSLLLEAAGMTQSPAMPASSIKRKEQGVILVAGLGN
jgi:hypothetical protein